MRARTRSAITAAALGLALGGTASAQELNRIAATVGREAITTSEVERTAQTMRKAAPEVADLNPEQLRALALEELINREIMRTRMTRLGLSVSDAEVNRALENMLGRAGVPPDRIDLMLEREGVSKKEYMARLQAELERRKMIELEVRPHVVVGEAEIEAYYQEHIEEFSAPTRVRVLSLLVAVPEDAASFERDEARQKAQDLKAIAETGEKPFEELVREHSDGPTAEAGGELGTFEPGQLRDDWAEVVFSLEQGQIGGPVESPDGFRLLQAAEVAASGPIAMTEVKGEIRERLLDGELSKTYDRWIERIREDVHIERLVDYDAS